MMSKTRAAAYRSVFDNEVDDEVDANAITISVHENDVPSFVEHELDRLYGNLYSSLTMFKVKNKLRNASTYVLRKGGKAMNVFLFRVEGSKITVLNEVIAISEAEIRQFVTIIFSRFRKVQIISFGAVETDSRELPFPYQKINHLEDIVVTLPGTQEQYLANLGKNTRRNFKRYANRFKLDFPSSTFEIHVQEAASDQTIRDIVELNKARMQGKNKVSAIDSKEVDNLIKLVKACGMVCTATIDGKVCAGAISFRVGQNYFLNVLAHDPQYDNYWLGMLCCYHTIGECIARHGKEFHFLWGRYDYKYTLLGNRRDLDLLIVYRSRRQIILNSDMALMAMIKGQMRRLMLWMNEAKRQDSRAYHLASGMLNSLRGLQQFKLRLAGKQK